MSQSKNSIIILVADDDQDDRDMIKDAFRENRLAKDLRFVNDGEELMNYLLHRGKFQTESDSPRPGLILLDLNMPKKDGREALKEIKAHPDLKQIPVVVLTTSKAEEDVYRTYDLGVSSFITKPVTFDALVSVTRAFSRYWLEIVELPATTKQKE